MHSQRTETPFDRRLVIEAALLFLLLASVYSFSAGLRATRNASITGDEPFYLMTTASILEDGNLDLREQYVRESYRSFFDHPGGLWLQSIPTENGRILSPHEPGLSVLVVPGFWLDGLRGTQIELLLIAALTFALTYVLVVGETGERLMASLATAAVGLSATAFVYSTEIYPEVPAALTIVLALLVLRRARLGVVEALLLVLLLSCLVWLSMKFAVLGSVVALFFVWRAGWSTRAWFLVSAAISAFVYLAFHLAVYDHYTAYNINAVYRGASTESVLAAHIAFEDRYYRLWGLFLDARFGLARWAPVILAAVVALPLLPRVRSIGGPVLCLIIVQVLVATFAAITMMGWWFPGRMLVSVLPLLALPLTMLLVCLPNALRVAVGALTALGCYWTFALWQAARSGDITLAVDPFYMHNGLFRFANDYFPDYRGWGTDTFVLTGVWLGALLVLASVIAFREYGAPVPLLSSRRRSGNGRVATESSA